MTRLGYVMAAYVAAMATAVVAQIHPRPLLIWNASASAPIGLYALHRTDDPPLGALVAVTPPPPLASWLAQRHYLSLGAPLIKHVAAKAEHRVCRAGDLVSVDGSVVAKAHQRDRRGRLLPVWTGCRTLRVGEVFLLNPDVSDSLDGRYFGPLPTRAVVGRVTPILTRPHVGGALSWRGLQP